MQGSGQPASALQSAPPVIDYEGSRYRTEFWEGQGRQYEDAAERLALQELLPARGGCIAEIGAGFGRLAELYDGYGRVVLFDYSRSLLREAVQRWGHDPRFVFVAGNVYTLPLASGVRRQFGDGAGDAPSGGRTGSSGANSPGAAPGERCGIGIRQQTQRQGAGAVGAAPAGVVAAGRAAGRVCGVEL